MKKLFIILCVALLGSGCTLQSDRIEVAIITGISNKEHNCKEREIHLVKTFAKNPELRTTVVDVTEPENEVINFEKYDVLVMNTIHAEWDDEQRRRFERYVSGGGGLVIIHEASNGFKDWEEYNKMTALGGWGERDESAGAYYYFEGGEFVTDSISEGPAGSFGRKVPFVINLRDKEHPITEGLPESWYHFYDELYSNLRGPAKGIHPLATAFSDSEKGGSGKEELVFFTVDYGEGRVFHSVLGHSGRLHTKSFYNEGLNAIWLRATEWAATGEVKTKFNFEPVEFTPEDY